MKKSIIGTNSPNPSKIQTDEPKPEQYGGLKRVKARKLCDPFSTRSRDGCRSFAGERRPGYQRARGRAAETGNGPFFGMASQRAFIGLDWTSWRRSIFPKQGSQTRNGGPNGPPLPKYLRCRWHKARQLVGVRGFEPPAPSSRIYCPLP
jgi:hypothetical protein